MKIGYLGPKGTFTEIAALYHSKGFENVEMIDFNSMADALMAVEAKLVDECVVPFENSIEGTVTNTIDTLIFDVNLYIKAELILPIEHNLFVKKDYNNEKIEKIISHPQALSQCRKFCSNNFKNVPLETVSSTSKAAETVSKSNEFIAGIGTSRAAELYGLKILEKSIQDEMNNETRFVVVSSEKSPKINSKDKTSIVFSTRNKPGELYRILDIISIWDLNMTKIESRPMKSQLGTYVFFVELETDNVSDLTDGLKMIERKTSFFKYLGSYPVFNKNQDL